MNVTRMLKDTFSPHELAVMAGPPAIIFFVCGISVATGPLRLLSLIFIPLSFVWAIFFGIVSRCPTCGKSPWFSRPFSSDSLFAKWQRANVWPERECSGCRTSLDVI